MLTRSKAFPFDNLSIFIDKLWQYGPAFVHLHHISVKNTILNHKISFSHQHNAITHHFYTLAKHIEKWVKAQKYLYLHFDGQLKIRRFRFELLFFSFFLFGFGLLWITKANYVTHFWYLVSINTDYPTIEWNGKRSNLGDVETHDGTQKKNTELKFYFRLWPIIITKPNRFDDYKRIEGEWQKKKKLTITATRCWPNDTRDGSKDKS